MDKVIFFIALSLPVIFFSKQSLFEPHSHGFTRFFSWEGIIILFVFNYTVWFRVAFLSEADCIMDVADHLALVSD